MTKLEELRRALPRRERRFVEGAAELRAAPDEPPRIHMHIPFGRRSVEMFGFTEIIDPGAFTKTLQERGSDVVALWNHDPLWVLARQSNRKLSVAVDEIGLGADAELDPDDQMHQHFARRVERRDVVGSSFGFETVRDQWVNEADGSVIRTLLEVKLFDVSPVTFPAYPDSGAEKRSIEARVMEVAAARGIDAREFVAVLATVEGGRVAAKHVPSVRHWIRALERLVPAEAVPPAIVDASFQVRARKLDLLMRQHRAVA